MLELTWSWFYGHVQALTSDWRRCWKGLEVVGSTRRREWAAVMGAGAKIVKNSTMSGGVSLLGIFARWRRTSWWRLSSGLTFE